MKKTTAKKTGENFESQEKLVEQEKKCSKEETGTRTEQSQTTTWVPSQIMSLWTDNMCFNSHKNFRVSNTD